VNLLAADHHEVECHFDRSTFFDLNTLVAVTGKAGEDHLLATWVAEDRRPIDVAAIRSILDIVDEGLHSGRSMMVQHQIFRPSFAFRCDETLEHEKEAEEVVLGCNHSSGYLLDLVLSGDRRAVDTGLEVVAKPEAAVDHRIDQVATLAAGVELHTGVVHWAVVAEVAVVHHKRAGGIDVAEAFVHNHDDTNQAVESECLTHHPCDVCWFYRWQRRLMALLIF
jgi:hypothetical protein